MPRRHRLTVDSNNIGTNKRSSQGLGKALAAGRFELGNVGTEAVVTVGKLKAEVGIFGGATRHFILEHIRKRARGEVNGGVGSKVNFDLFGEQGPLASSI
jgi:hypothetical protein